MPKFDFTRDMRRSEIRYSADGKEFCIVEMRLENHDGGHRYTMTGIVGNVLSPAEARRQALECWASFFEESPEERRAMNEKCGCNCRTSMGAAKYVVRHDGEYHGLDVVAGCDLPDGAKDGVIHVGHSFGLCRDDVSRYFPEFAWAWAHHLNDMHSDCEHQEALGWGSDKIGHHCPTCGYRYGSAWLARPLPAEIYDLFQSKEEA